MSLKQKVKKIKSYLGWGIITLLSIILLYRFFYLGLNWPNFNKDIKTESFVLKQYLAEEKQNTKLNGEILASKNGTKYYFPNCSGLKRIKPENLVYFDSEEAAKLAGYELAKNCEKS